ncbi:MAG TPA: polysaccharide deacetylase family protein, partial [Candidatus Eisenbacteria bacterium]|nr:polysaccharide deacetylase family protein [Candidatus Eisenbacteria bacterium]
MMPQHDNFYDVYSKARKIRIEWPNRARMAIALAGNLEAWTEIPDAKHRRTHHVGGSNPIKEEDVISQYDCRTASENDYGGRTGVWRILRILDKYGVKASFNTNALCILRYPEAVKAVHERGHEIVGHSYAEDIQLTQLTE